MNLFNFAQILAAVASGVTQEDVPCMNEATAAAVCLASSGHDEQGIEDCLMCILEGTEDFEDSTTCEEIQTSNYCTDVGTCVGEKCSDACIEEVFVWLTCMASYAETEFGCNPCPGDESAAAKIA